MNTLYDVLVIGSGVAGINAAIYGASEGLRIAVIEKQRGGQIMGSSAVENLFSYATISGKELIQRAYMQAISFGAQFLPDTITHVRKQDNLWYCTGVHGQYRAKTVIVAVGMQYKVLQLPGMHESCENVHYGTVMEYAQQCVDTPVYIIGGANSAGQAAVYLSQYTNVTMLVRDSIEKSMSAYLIQKIQALPITVKEHCTVTSVHVDRNRIRSLQLSCASGSKEEYTCGELFVFIGAQPATAWLPEKLQKDPYGYIYTTPTMETNLAGMYAIGDIVANQPKRVIVALGHAAVAIARVHEYLAQHVQV